ncbi:MAG: sigma-54 dependent transcriptional regulator [bacterium]|nr:sigma-54 dependent transcriptional regulator [bacterium]
MPPTVLVADDNRTTTRTLGTLVERWGYEPVLAFDGAEALAVLEGQAVDVVITDLRMPVVDGMELLARLQERWPETVVIVATAYGTIESAVDAMKLGAFDYLTKPYDDKQLHAKLDKAVEQRRLMQRVEHLDARVASFTADRLQGMGEMMGASPGMRRVFDEIEKVAETDTTVLILGESGTGKELVAHAVHARSPRGEAAFVAAHCAAYAEGLLESELFGHEKGAFTGAGSARQGLVEAANGGTLFLDEVGELPLEAQARLLRVLQEGEIRRLGAVETRKVDVRLIAATHRDLRQLAQTGRFREDLFYRLNVVNLTLPALRDRGDDILELAERLLERACVKLQKIRLRFSDAALAALAAHHWPGNVRELENAVERAVILADGEEITPESLALGGQGGQGNPAPNPSLPTPQAAPSGQETDEGAASLEDYFVRFVRDNEGHMTETALAEKLGISRKSLWERRQRLGIPRRRGR